MMSYGIISTLFQLAHQRDIQKPLVEKFTLYPYARSIENIFSVNKLRHTKSSYGAFGMPS
jgi:hypothetical protein